MVEINIIRVLEGKGINGKEAFDNIIFENCSKIDDRHHIANLKVRS